MSKSLLCTHLIPAHWGAVGGRTDRDWLAGWNPPFVKVILDGEAIPYLDQLPRNAQIVVRHYPLSENFGARALSFRVMSPSAELKQEGSGRDLLRRDPVLTTKATAVHAAALTADPVATGQAHAAVCVRIAQDAEARGVNRARLTFEGLNEPQLWAGEPPAAVAAYYLAFLNALHAHDLRGVVGNFGVGWPGNGGVQDAPVQWDFFQPVVKAFWPGDHLGLHEYWAYNGPGENWRWWAGRYEQCPYKVPILITECGVDLGVLGAFHQYGGWADILPGASWEQRVARYLGDLFWYEGKALADGRIRGLCVFTYDIGSPHWERFNVRNEVWLKSLLAELARRPELSEPARTLPDALKAAGQAHQCIQFNPQAALQKRIFADGYVPNSGEFDVTHGGLTYRAQRAEHLATGAVRVYYARVGEWANVGWV